MAMFGKVLEPVGYMQTVRVLVQGICSYLGGSASAEESEAAKKNLDSMDQELGAGGAGLLDDQEVHRLEDDLAVVYYQLGTAVRAQAQFTKKETEVFLQYVQDYRLERQLMALYNRLMGVSALTDQPTLLEELILNRKPKRWELREFCVKINFVLGTGLLCLFTQASLTGRDQALLMKTWSDRMGALYRKMKNSGSRCLGYFLEQAEMDVRHQLQEAVQSRAPPEEAAGSILKTLEKNYDWLRWAVMLHPAVGPMEEAEEEGKEEETQQEEKEEKEEKEEVVQQSNNFISVASDPPVPHVVVCFRDTPTSLDKSRIHQLIVDLEWKIPNPPPEVYASIEEDPGRARCYLAARMLKKLQDGLGEGVSVHVVPGRMEMKSNFPPASYYLYEYKHRLASGTVCVFG
ncbi:Protein rapunzel [Dissostichus eleginoides]|uniref:Protein rapunzel n=1 Tax=Dissostichus eleginoides TaxID=100907 RepID=A0AAD9CKW9_DISEL|nr:Protein rapunzel [Dissostichus eleginoides]